MSITAAQVKELRARTGAGMMECKKALLKTDGDIDLAIDEMRKSGKLKAAKRAGRVAAEGRVVIQLSDDGKAAVLGEVNCETDFVAKGEEFAEFAEHIMQRGLDAGVETLDDLMALPYKTDAPASIEEVRENLVAKIGENIQVRRLVRVTSTGSIGHYLHNQRIGVLVALSTENHALGREIAMHVAFSRPLSITPAEVPAALVEKERSIFTSQSEASGKPKEIIEKMVEGRVKKFLSEVSLTEQPFVKEPKKTVGQLLNDGDASVSKFECFELGEGIEKEDSDFAAEVMSQVTGDK